MGGDFEMEYNDCICVLAEIIRTISFSVEMAASLLLATWG